MPLRLQIIEKLKVKPMTSVEMAWALGREQNEISTLLSKMAIFGAIGRDKLNGNKFLYRLKQS